ncbi:MAG: cytochrome P450 [Hyphomonadaceae bacterium]
MAEHRTEPRFEEGRFVPPHPERLQTESPGFLEQLAIIHAATQNPLKTLSEGSFVEPVVQTNFMGLHLTQISDPAMIRHCFIENRNNYRMSALRQAIFKPVAREGLISAEGDTWKHARRTLSPIFTPRNIAFFADGMKASVERDIPEFLHDGETVEMSELTTSLTYLVLSDALFTGGISGARGEVLALIGGVLNTMGRPHFLDLIGAPTFLPRLGRAKGMTKVEQLRALIREIAVQRLSAKERGEPLPQDFLTLMIGVDGEDAPFTLDEIEDQMVTFIGAGHETTAQALGWMFYLLSQDKDARARAEAEVDALDTSRPPVEWSDALPFTMACFREALRLYPPAAAIMRQANEEDRFGDICIPKDGAAMLHLYVLHRHEALWEHPNAFMPDRFLGEAREKIDRFQYLPFGVGHRVCIGERFAMVEAGILIASLMGKFRFDYAGEAPPVPTIRLSMQPEQGMRMKVTLR